MPFKLVTRDSISKMIGDVFYIDGNTFIGKKVNDAVAELRELGYCASERALVDVGCYPIKAIDADGSKVFVIKLN